MSGEMNNSKDAANLRQRSEKIAQLNSKQKLHDHSSLTKEEAIHLIHELQVHQIELELQNEELRQTQVELEHERARYFDLYEMAPVGYLTISKNGVILENNLMISNMLQSSRAVLFHKPITQLILREDQDIYYLSHKRLMQTGEPQICELRMVKNNSTAFWVRMTAVSAADRFGEMVCRVTVSDITSQKEAEVKLKYQTMHDILTGVYNRTYFEESLDQLEQGRQYPISIVMLDVDKLKSINDQYGHAAGDRALINTAQILKRAFRVDDVIARIGGDEFAVLMPNTTKSDAETVVERVKAEIKKFNKNSPEYTIHISCGLSTTNTKSVLADTLKEADKKMYLNKQGRKTEENL